MSVLRRWRTNRTARSPHGAGASGADRPAFEHGAEVAGQGLGTLVPPGRLLGQAGEDHGFEIAGQGRANLARPRRLFGQNLRNHEVRHGRFEDRHAGGQLVEGRAQTIQISAPVDRLPERCSLFGAHVARGAHQHATEGQGHLVGALGQAEVGEPDDPLGVEQEVRGLDVAMDHPTPVGMRERLGRLKAPASHVVELERLTRSLRFAENVSQAAAVDQLHGVVMHAALAADGEDRHDVGVVQPGDGLGLAMEPMHRLLIGHGAKPENLQGHATAQRGLLGLVDDAHAAAAELADDPELAQGRRISGRRTGRLVDEFDAGQASLELPSQLGMSVE